MLPVIAQIIARGAAILGRIGPALGRAIGGVGKSIGGATGRVARQAGVAIRQGGRAAGQGLRGSLQQGAPPLNTRPGRRGGLGGGGRRRPVTPRGQAGSGGRRGGRSGRRAPVNFGQAFRRSVRQGMRGAAQRSRAQHPVQQFIQRFIPQSSPVGRILQNFNPHPGAGRTGFGGGRVQFAIDPLRLTGDLLRGFYDLSKAIVKFPALIRDWGAAVIESKRALGEFNATYSVAAGRLDINRFRRNVQLGGATSGNFRNLTAAQSRLEDKLLPYQITATNALLRIVSELADTTRLLVIIGEGVAKVTRWSMIMDAVGKFVNMGGPGQIQNQPLADVAEVIARGNFVQQRQKPPMPPMNNAANQPVGGAGQGAQRGGFGV